MGARNEAIRRQQGQETNQALLLLHYLPEMRQNLRQELRSTFRADSLSKFVSIISPLQYLVRLCCR